MSLQTDKNSILEYFRPRGKIVCIGNDLTTELGIVNDYLATRNEDRLPQLFITTNSAYRNDICDQVVIFDSETMMPQIYRLLNSYFLIFIFNSSEDGIFKLLGAILASIEFSGSIPLFIDTGKGLSQKQKELFGDCYFNFDCSLEKGKQDFLIFLDSVISGLTPSGIGVSFSNLIRIFGNSKYMFYGISSSNDLSKAIGESIDQIGEKLVSVLPEELEKLQVIFLSINSKNSLSLKTMDKTSRQIIKIFGKEIEVIFSHITFSQVSDYDIVIILTDSHPIDSILHNSTSTDLINSVIPKLASFETSNEKNPSNRDVIFSDTCEDERFKVLNKIFLNSEIYIFDDGGLPLFASHRPAGQEVCLYTGLFSAIQSMSSDLIGHTPDHLTAGDKQCVFISQPGPHNSQLRGVAIFNTGFEQSARNDLAASMNLVKEHLEKGEPEYAINDKIQGLLVDEFQKGSLDSILKSTDFHAS
ncbi:MAG: hypothetical protein ACFFC6_09575 [Promethearchaeota archaeon]